MRTDRFLNELAEYPNSKTVKNPYQVDYALGNLKKYLQYVDKQRGKRVLLVGEAPGHRGCAITGIPFTSGRVFRKFEHPLLLALRDKIVLPSVEAESTATIVWEYLSTKGATPLFWNSFPFHPHKERKPKTNCVPNAHEVRIGVDFLKKLVDLYGPDTIAAIGLRGMKGLRLAFPNRNFYCIRHPSNGGKKDFIRDMSNVI